MTSPLAKNVGRHILSSYPKVTEIHIRSEGPNVHFAKTIYLTINNVII